MKIEEGKLYRTRDGRMAKVLTTEADMPLPVIAMVDRKIWQLLPNGRDMADGSESKRDLIAEWGDVVDYVAWAVVDKGVALPALFVYHEDAKRASRIGSRVVRVSIKEMENGK
jgi:hypothetical protein